MCMCVIRPTQSRTVSGCWKWTGNEQVLSILHGIAYVVKFVCLLGV